MARCSDIITQYIYHKRTGLGKCEFGVRENTGPKRPHAHKSMGHPKKLDPIACVTRRSGECGPDPSILPQGKRPPLQKQKEPARRRRYEKGKRLPD